MSFRVLAGLSLPQRAAAAEPCGGSCCCLKPGIMHWCSVSSAALYSPAGHLEHGHSRLKQLPVVVALGQPARLVGGRWFISRESCWPQPQLRWCSRTILVLMPAADGMVVLAGVCFCCHSHRDCQNCQSLTQWQVCGLAACAAVCRGGGRQQLAAAARWPSGNGCLHWCSRSG